MRNFYVFITMIFLSFITQAQTFEFGIVFNGLNSVTNNYQFAFVATPNSTVVNGVIQDVGGGFYIPTGLTIGNFEQGDSNLPASEWSSLSMGSGASGDAYFLSRVEGGAGSIILNGSGPFQLVLFDVIADPNPTSGNLLFVENGDPVFDTIFVQNYINMNINSTGTQDVYLQNDPSASNISFSTLSISKIALQELVIYPNPAKNWLTINGDYSTINRAEIYSISGQLVREITHSFEKINTANLQSGIYFLKLSTETSNKTIKFIKE